MKKNILTMKKQKFFTRADMLIKIVI